MSLWFIYALISVLFAGLHTFLLKVSVEKKYDTYLLSAASAFVSFILGVIATAIFSSWTALPASVYWFGALSGVLFAGFSIARMEGLRHIDAAIFFPMYKVIGPALVAGIGIFLFKEVVTPIELTGIILSCIVPLLLITRQENHRQKNLKLGLIFMVVGTTLASIAAGVNAFAVDSNQSFVLPLATLANGFTCFFAAALYFRKHPRNEMYHAARPHFTKEFICMALVNGVIQMLSFFALLYAFALGDLSIVYSINAHYIIIPVILSVWFYKEHWNFQKAFALAVSIFALILLHH